MHVFRLTTAAWHFRDATKRSAWRTAVVPGCVHRDLQRHRLIPDPFWSSNEAQLQWIEEHDWEYRASFRLPAALRSAEVVELVADGLDTVATIWVNGVEVGRAENMFLGQRWNVRPQLRPGRNELRVRFESAMRYIRRTRPAHQPREINDPVGRCVVIRKQQCQFGWDWGPRFVTAGIWRDLRLEAWSGNRLESVKVTQTHEVGAGEARPTSDPAGKLPALPATRERAAGAFGGGRVRLTLEPEFARPAQDVTLRWTWTLEANTCRGASLGLARSGRRPELRGTGSGTEIVIESPKLWWPNGHGPQPLYRLEVEAVAPDGASLGRWQRRIGLRTIRLDRHQDAWGESFQFVVNGRPLFAKGANWIPAHTFVAGLRRADYARDLTAAAAAHMNMIRVWGGGIYESDDFYDLCDELGLLVWQDFMFACTMYPADEAMVDSVRREAEFQVRRLRHRASLALWCGNNEIAGLNLKELGDPATRRGYEEIFHRTLPEAVRAIGSGTDYWPSSPWRGGYENDHAMGEQRGDTHFWDVWHARHPVRDYEKYAFRFVSEFGMQSFSSPETNATFCPPHDDNVFGPEMENHQKNRFGNQIILDYVSRRYRFPAGQDALIYLSQLNQAYCMQVGVEHWRRAMPRCMGALYWQLNDCWPVASWSSIEFTGRWRALHHVARRFFAPAIVSAKVLGEETTIIGNYRRSSIHSLELYTVCDAPEPAQGVLVWEVRHLDGRTLASGRKPVVLRPGQSVCQHTLELGKPEGGRLGQAPLPPGMKRKEGRDGSPSRATSLLQQHSLESIYVRIALDVADGGRDRSTPPKPGSRRGRETPPDSGQLQRVSEDTVFLTEPRFLELPRGRTQARVKMETPTRAILRFVSDVFQHRFAFELRGVSHRASDNYFELYPGEERTVVVDCDRPQTAAGLKRRLSFRSLVDTY